MLERIDPQLHHAEPRPAAGTGGDRRRGRTALGPAAVAARAAEHETAPDLIDETLARLAATIADVERFVREEEPAEPNGQAPDVPAVAARIAANAAAALAAQAAIGPAGVRLMLEAGPPAVPSEAKADRG